MDNAERTLETAVYAMAEGIATRDQIALLEADHRAWRLMLERLIDDTEDQLDEVRHISGPERDQVVADFLQELHRLETSYDLLTKVPDPHAVIAGADPGGEVRLQASWEAGKIVVWAAGPGTKPEGNDELADRLEAIGGPKLGWTVHADVPLPSGARAAAVAIPVQESLGWLVAVGGGLGRDGVGASVVWLGRVALSAVRMVAQGAVVPALHADKRPNGRSMDLAVRWSPALLDPAVVDQLAAAMPGPVIALKTGTHRAVTIEVLNAVVDAIVREAAGRVDAEGAPARHPDHRRGGRGRRDQARRLRLRRPHRSGHRGLEAPRAVGQAGAERGPTHPRRPARPS